MSISTRKGDSGQTDLLFGQRVQKHHPRIVALGDVDELNAALGLVRVHASTNESRELAAQTQLHLISLMGELATPAGSEERYGASHRMQIISDAEITWLDGWVEKLEREGEFKFTGWVLPGAAGHAGGAFCDHARAVCRRAERSIMALSASGDALPSGLPVTFLNRLSDVLWLLARWEEKERSA